MKGKFIFLVALALVQGRPPDEENYDNNEDPILFDGCPEDQQHFLLPHEDNCTKFYYCEYGMRFPTPRDCAPGTHFSFEQQICDLPEKAGCVINGSHATESDKRESDSKERDSVSDDNASGEVVGVENGGNKVTGDDEDDEEIENQINNEESEATRREGTRFNNNTVTSNGGRTSWLPNGCPVDIHIHHLLPHESDCTKFYHCVRGEKVLRECAPGTHFNPTIQVCDWPQNAGCTAGGGGGENGGGGGNNGGGGAEPNPNVKKCETSCNVLPWAHETECGKFWICDGTKAILGVCSEGLHFNPETHTCDFICNVSCVRKNILSSVQPDGLKIFLPWNKVNPDLIKRYLMRK